MGRLKSFVQRRMGLSRVRAGNVLRSLGVPLKARARVVYHPDYAIPSPQGAARHAIDIWRADRIIEQAERVGIVRRDQVITPEPVSREDLLRVHPESFLSDLSRGTALEQLFFLSPGHGLEAQELLRPFLLQTGGTIAAAEHALRRNTTVFNLGGGFHHAQRVRAEGFCPINDLAVTILRMRERRLAHRVLVVDLDYHQGNGTSLIFSDDEGVFTLSVLGQSWAHVADKDNNIDLELPAGTGDRTYLAAVRQGLAEALSRFRPDLVLYVAGADPHHDDDLGDFAISDDGMLERDLLVFETIRAVEAPLVVVLGGGYGSMAWTLPYNFLFSVLTGDRIDPSHRPGNIQAAYRRVGASLTPRELQAGAGDLSAVDLEDLFGRESSSGSRLFMEYYTRSGIETAFDRYGLMQMLRERGFDNLILWINTDDPDRQILRMHFDLCDRDHLLLELVTRFRTLITPPEAREEGVENSFRMVSIEWLMMQDPRASFSLERQRLPGQNFPGLGIGRWMVEMLRIMAERLDCTGLMNIPEHYHNAFLYSKQMLCFCPEDQGMLEALKRDLAHLPLVDASAAIDEGRLRRVGQVEAVPWQGKAQVMPVKPELNSYFTRPAYIRAVAEAREGQRFEISELAPEKGF